MTMTHDDVWNAIDALAASRSMSVSRLARNAGLDPTTFNRSKRVSVDGRLRWPSTESIAKVLAVTGVALEDMIALGADDGSDASGDLADAPPVRVPVIGIAHAGHTEHMTQDGSIKGTNWSWLEIPRPSRSNMVGFKVEGGSMLPLYRDGDTLIVSLNDPVSPGNRVVVRTHEGDVMVKELACNRDRIVLVTPGDDDAGTVSYARDEIAWLARIRWASQ